MDLTKFHRKQRRRQQKNYHITLRFVLMDRKSAVYGMVKYHLNIFSMILDAHVQGKMCLGSHLHECYHIKFELI